MIIQDPNVGLLRVSESEYLGVRGLTILDDDKFRSRKRSVKIDKIVIHESVTFDPDIDDLDGKDDRTELVLCKRGLGVHIMVSDRGGQPIVVQHNNLVDSLAHAGALNKTSIGIEIINPYYKMNRPRKPWTSGISKAKWAHKGYYTLPSKAQMYAMWNIIKAICDSKPDNGRIDVPLSSVGLEGNFFNMTNFTNSSKEAGIWAHGHHYTIRGGKRKAHADGLFPSLYTELRIRGYEHDIAYSSAVELASKATRRGISI